MTDKWDIWIDTGGTFTDCLARNPSGSIQRLKVLSSSALRAHIARHIAPDRLQLDHTWPVHTDLFGGYTATFPGRHNVGSFQVLAYDPETRELQLDSPITQDVTGADLSLTAGEEAPILAARLATQTPLSADLPPIRMRLGSTRGTNALLERKGARVGLLITRGFRDLPYIGNQARPDLFQLDIPEPDRLYHSVTEVDERLGANGEVHTALSLETIQSVIEQLREADCDSVAIALLHAYRNPVHEQQLALAVREAGFDYVSVSHELSPVIKLLPRTRTALVNAYLAPVIHHYLDRIASTIGVARGTSDLLVMSSAGGLVSYQHYRPKDSLLSGPAGGMVGAATIGHQLGIRRLLTLDMGGTSTDTARYDHQYDYRFRTEIDGIVLNSPTLAIETVAAGGGSICRFDGQKLQVGPESAGADPGPACYGAGGPLTITDVNLLLGKFQPDRMGIPIRVERAEKALEALRQQVSAAMGQEYDRTELLRGLEKIANEKMAEAIRKISVARGFNPADYALLAFGGAGGMHAAQVADLLGIRRLVLPFNSGILSAFGIGNARVERLAERQVLRPLEELDADLPQLIHEVSQEAREALQQEGYTGAQTSIRQRLLFLRFRGQDSPLEIDITESAAMPERTFQKQYEQLFGYFPSDRVIEVESLRVIAATRADLPRSRPEPKSTQPAFPAEHKKGYPVYLWKDLRPGSFLNGPAVVLNDHATVFLPKGWSTKASHDQNLIAQRSDARSSDASESLKEGVELELFTNRFSAIAEEMGAQLQRTAFSVNVKERLDFSCGLLNPRAELLVNAPHIPVHLGSLGVCARLCLERQPIGPGDVLLTNHPKYGGSHLPDVTLLSGVYTKAGALIGYVINRAHHAEIGGTRPGSMPPDATRLEEEGVAFPPTFLVRAGQVKWDAIRETLERAPYPSRSPDENIADIRAALASLRKGAEALQTMVRIHGLEKVHYYMDRVQDLAANTLESGLAAYQGHLFEATEYLDDDHRIQVAIDLRSVPYRFDFSGSSAPHPFNLNANLSIVYSAVLYVLRLLCDRIIPLNEGLMRTIELKVPTSLLHPDFVDDAAKCPAVVGGNTEVSQRLVDTLLKALGLAACSQGTMNNFLFGNQSFGYYETIGGGAGAGTGFHGRSGVHQHMTNTRLTDPEELEFRYPVRVDHFGLRQKSGGRGQWHGGDGLVREITFMEPVEFTLLSQHRVVAPYGLEGGEPGRVGQQWLIKANGDKIALKGIDHKTLEAGDRIRIETPGGGGYGVNH